MSIAAPSAALGPYDLLVEVAAGGMATVYVARHSEGARDSGLVAIKRPHRHLAVDKAFLTMLVDEARLASAIDHPNVAKVRELRFDSGVPFIVMDYVEGASLADLRRELGAVDRRLDARLGSSIALDALEGLQAAHELKDARGNPLTIIHRDVSPHNILVACDGRALLTDFGIAKAQDRIQTTRTHEVKGKLAYLAPERVDERRMCTVQSDVFSMGVVLWECLAGRRLFRDGEVFEVLHDIVHAPIPRLGELGAQVPRALDDAIARALSRDLGTRFPSARAFAEAIAASMDTDRADARADVAKVMASVFESTIRERRERIQDALDRPPSPSRTVEHRETHDEPPPSSATYGTILDALAPKSPDGRYLGHADAKGSGTTARRRAWMVNGGVLLFGLSVGGVLTAVLMNGWSQSPPRPSEASSVATSLLSAERAPSANPASVGPTEESVPPPPETVDPPDAGADAGPRGAHARVLRPIGTVRNGFTKLR
ncbi:MAG TPA: serine/threonine-protein kinase [Polyangiaceae bacterium]|nr:serine/threonine-protein kinase [Polyangiaceae bacterium]